MIYPADRGLRHLCEGGRWKLAQDYGEIEVTKIATPSTMARLSMFSAISPAAD